LQPGFEHGVDDDDDDMSMYLENAKIDRDNNNNFSDQVERIILSWNRIGMNDLNFLQLVF